MPLWPADNRPANIITPHMIMRRQTACGQPTCDRADRDGLGAASPKGEAMPRKWKGLIVALMLAQAVTGCVINNAIFKDCTGKTGSDLEQCQLGNTMNLLFALGLFALVGGVIASHHHHDHAAPGNVSFGGSCTPNC